MRIIKSRPFGSVAPAALAELEANIGNPLPAQFRAFLLEHNGPLITPCEFHVEDYTDGIDGELYGLHQNKEKDLREAYFTSSLDWPPDLLPFASDGGGNEIGIGLSGTREGKIFFIDHELHNANDPEAGVIHLADSLDFFSEIFFEYKERMSPKEARNIILTESREGIACSSRMGDYGTPGRFQRIIEAITVLQTELRRETKVDRELVAALFSLGDQVHGNAHGASHKGIAIPDWLWETGLPSLSEALYAIFEDYGSNKAEESMPTAHR